MNTNARHFALYKKECKKHASKLSLKEWALYFEHGNGIEGSLSSCSVDFGPHSAILYLGKDWNIPITNDDIAMCARHEVMEIMLFPVRFMLWERFNVDVVDEEIHKIINRLEGAI